MITQRYIVCTKDSIFSYSNLCMVTQRYIKDSILSYLQIDRKSLSDMTHDRMNELALVIPLFTSLNIFLTNSTFAQINVTFLFIHTQDHDGLDSPDLDQAAHTPDPTAGELGEEDHAFDVVVLEERHVGSHVGDVFDLDRDGELGFRRIREARKTTKRQRGEPLNGVVLRII